MFGKFLKLKSLTPFSPLPPNFTVNRDFQECNPHEWQRRPVYTLTLHEVSCCRNSPFALDLVKRTAIGEDVDELGFTTVKHTQVDFIKKRALVS